MSQVEDLVGQEPISCFAWNGDRTQLAIAPNSNEVLIFKKTGSTWEKEATLKEHGQRVRGMDWSPKSNHLVTCGDDRNAYVWTKQADGKWKPMLVLLRINRAATCVKWSPKENKFAVGCGARLISVCYFEEEQNWWVSKHIKKPIQSTILSLDWHPNNCLLVAGSSDFKCRVFSGYIKEVESKPEATPWGKKMPFGNLMAEFSNGNGGWIHSAAFSPSGDRIVWVSHNSSISVVDATNESRLTTITTNHLPLLSVLFASETSIIAAGHDCAPMSFKFEAGKISFVAKLDNGGKAKKAGGVSAMDKFRNMDSKGAAAGPTGTVMDTTHQNAITQMVPYSSPGSAVTKVTTSGVDGLLVTWDLK